MNYSQNTVTVGARVERGFMARLDRVVRVLGMRGRSEAIREAMAIGLRWLEGRAAAVTAEREVAE